MDDKLISLFYGSVLHDIGKIVQRATKQRVKHSKLGGDFLSKFTSDKEILNQVRYHHAAEIMGSSIRKDDLAYITYIADNIASGVDRRQTDIATDQLWDSKTSLEDVYNRFGNENDSPRYFQARELDLVTDDIFAKKNKLKFTDSEYSAILKRIETTLNVVDFNEKYFQSILNLLEATTSFIPSSTNMTEVADISLYDHLRLTAGFAAAIYLFLKNAKISDFKQELFKNSKNFYQEKAFLLVSFDISGIQSFIYTITSQGAHKQLRSRSFYLDMISEWIVDSLLQMCNLTRANLVYSGGGHAYIIFPNVAESVATIKKIEKSFNDFFLENFQTKLFVAFGWSDFSAAQVMQNNDISEYLDIYRKISRQISRKKLERYSFDDLLKLNGKMKKSGRECSICHNVTNLVEIDGQYKCQLCYKLEMFSKNIQKEQLFEVNNDDSGLPVGPKSYLHKISIKQIKNNEYSGRVYSKNELNTGAFQATHLWIGDYSDLSNNEFSSYAQRKWTLDKSKKITGIKRIAVLRCDVDDLGYGFMAGFSQQHNGIYNTFSRTAAFSRSMGIFFKLYINQFAKGKHLTIVYAGGDDVFILGSWDDILQFSIDLRQNFLKWTNHKLTLSSGIGIFSEKTPINIMARITGQLEDNAKQNGKNSICLFEKKFVFKYDEFINDIFNDKLITIRNFFDSEDQRGKAFIYKLIELIRSRDEVDRISFARLAYYLARLEEISKNKSNFKQFKFKMKDWFDDREEICETELALMLYVYEIREES